MCDRSKLALWRTIQTGTKEAACSKLSEVLAASPSPLQTEGWQSLLAWCWTQSIACHTTFSEKPEIKAKPNSMRFESKSGREYFSGQRCWLRLICSKNKIVASLSLGPCSNPQRQTPSPRKSKLAYYKATRGCLQHAGSSCSISTPLPSIPCPRHTCIHILRSSQAFPAYLPQAYNVQQPPNGSRTRCVHLTLLWWLRCSKLIAPEFPFGKPKLHHVTLHR